jgi:hypothetical protein
LFQNKLGFLAVFSSKSKATFPKSEVLEQLLLYENIPHFNQISEIVPKTEVLEQSHFIMDYFNTSTEKYKIE